MSCVSNTFCLGGSLFCSGLLMDLNRAGDSLYQGGEFFAEIQRGVRRTTAVGKRVDTYGFYPLNSRFPLFLNLTQIRDRRPLRKGVRQRIFSSAGRLTAVHVSAYSQRQITYCYTHRPDNNRQYYIVKYRYSIYVHVRLIHHKSVKQPCFTYT